MLSLNPKKYPICHIEEKYIYLGLSSNTLLCTKQIIMSTQSLQITDKFGASRELPPQTVAGTEPMQRHAWADRAQQPLCATHRSFEVQEMWFYPQSLSGTASMWFQQQMPKHTQSTQGIWSVWWSCWGKAANFFCSAIFAGILLRLKELYFFMSRQRPQIMQAVS